MTHEVDVVDVAPRMVAVKRFHVDYGKMTQIGESTAHALSAVASTLGAAHVAPDGPAMALYEPRADGFDIAAGFVVDAPLEEPSQVEVISLDGTRAAHSTHVGSYASLSTAWEDLQTEASAQNLALRANGPMWEEYWSMPDTPPDRTRTEIYWPLANADR
jgi:effector-binding domain-containing protein